MISLSVCLSVGLVTEPPQLTHYWVVLFHPRAQAKLTPRICPLVDYLGTTLSCLMPVRGGSILRPAPLRSAGTTDSQGRLLPGAARGSPRRGGWFRIRFRSRYRCLRLRPVCSRLFRCRCRLFPRQTPIYSRLLPPPLWDTCPPPPLRHLSEPQNRLCCNKLRDRNQ